MRCTQITEGAEPSSHTWNDNYLCLPNDSNLNFYWSSAGPINNKNCVQWLEPVDPHTWDDNYLCWDRNNPQPINGTIDTNYGSTDKLNPLELQTNLHTGQCLTGNSSYLLGTGTITEPWQWTCQGLYGGANEIGYAFLNETVRESLPNTPNDFSMVQ